MKAVKPFTILLFSFFITNTIFSQSNALLNYLPANAKTIIKINSTSLRQKMKWEDLMNTKLFTDFLKEVPQEGKDFIKNPEHTGIDLGQGFFVVMPSNAGKGTKPVIYGIPKDTARFSAMIKKLNPQKKITKVGNGKLFVDKNTAVAWNKEIFIITGIASKEQTASQTAKDKAAAELAQTKQLTEKSKALLARRPTAFSNEYFTSLLKEDGDIYLWTNNTIQGESKKGKSPVFGMLNRNLMQRAEYNSGIIKFESGKAVMQMKRYMPPSLDSIYSKYSLGNINLETLKKLPAGQPLLVISFHFSPDMLNEILTKTGADNVLDSLNKKNIKKDDILAAIKGDAMIAVMKASDFSKEDSVTSKLMGLQVFIAGGINDKEKFKSLTDSWNAKKDSSSQESNNPLGKIPKPFVLSNDSFFVASISQIAAQNFLSSPGNNSAIENLFQPYKNHPSVSIVDLRTIFGLAGPFLFKRKSQEEAEQTAKMLGAFDKLISYGGQYTSNYVSTTVELTLVNKDENSLKQFLNLLDLLNSMKPQKASTAYNR